MSSSTVLPHLLSQSLAPASHALACLPQTVSLLSLHAPFANQASPLPGSVVSFVKAIDAYVLGKDVEGRLVGWTIAKMIVEQGGADILETWGRSWVVGLMPLVGVSSSSGPFRVSVRPPLTKTLLIYTEITCDSSPRPAH